MGFGLQQYDGLTRLGIKRETPITRVTSFFVLVNRLVQNAQALRVQKKNCTGIKYTEDYAAPAR